MDLVTLANDEGRTADALELARELASSIPADDGDSYLSFQITVWP